MKSSRIPTHSDGLPKYRCREGAKNICIHFENKIACALAYATSGGADKLEREPALVHTRATTEHLKQHPRANHVVLPSSKAIQSPKNGCYSVSSLDAHESPLIPIEHPRSPVIRALLDQVVNKSDAFLRALIWLKSCS